MNSFIAGIEALGTVISSAESVVQCFQALRKACSDEEWDELCGGPLEELLDSCSDLECDIELIRIDIDEIDA